VEGIAINSPRRIEQSGFSLEIAKHDNHSFEVKTNYSQGDLCSLWDIDLFLFLPTSVGLSAWHKSVIHSDFRYRARLGAPVIEQASDDQVGLKIEALRSARGKEGDEAALVALVNTAIFFIKRKSERLQKEIFFAHSLLVKPERSQAEFRDICEQIRVVELTVCQARDEFSAVERLRPLADEYVSFHFVQLLGSLRKSLDQIKSSKDIDPLLYAPAWAIFESTMEELQAKEKNRGGRSSTLNVEDYLLKMSHLKKFFQAQSYINIEKRSMTKRIAEPMAALGAATSGLFVAMLESMNRSAWLSVGSKTGFVLMLGVALYVLRDRIKDQARALFMDHAAKILPEIKQRLFASNRQIGVIKEWFALKSSKELPEEVLDLRYVSQLSEIDSTICEDVVHHQRRLEFSGSKEVRARIQNQGFGMSENLRVNIERFLKNLDDPFKEHSYIDGEGKISSISAHRIYHFHVCLRVKRFGLSSQRKPMEERSFVFRLEVDKNGIDQIDQIQLECPLELRDGRLMNSAALEQVQLRAAAL
jgi:hypothetical protein